MRRTLGKIVLCGLLGLLAAGRPLAQSADTRLVVIVNRSRTEQLSLDDVARIYLKRRRFWDDGEPIVPLNREPESAGREAFSLKVLGKPSARLADYWNEQYFHGVSPPVTLASDAAVKRYVATDPSAIGYIDVHTLDDSVRVVLRLDE